MSVVRITIKKALIPGTYAQHHALTSSFSTEYLVRTRAAFPSSTIKEYARNIASVESRFYHRCVRFEEVFVKLATPGAGGQQLRGQFFYVDLKKLQGQLPLEEDEMLAYPPVAAAFGREAVWGRHGRLLLPHVLTTAEWNLYAQKRVYPQRFQRPNNSRTWPFSDELMEAIRAEDGTYVMPGEDEDEEGLRKIWDFFFTGFQVSTTKTKRKKSSKKSTVRRVAALAGEAAVDDTSLGTSRSARSKAPVAGVVYMLQAGQYFKIGMTISLEKRLTQIKLQLPHAATLIHVIQATDPSQAESHWHRRFAALRRNGEWFELSSAEVNEFKSISEM